MYSTGPEERKYLIIRSVMKKTKNKKQKTSHHLQPDIKLISLLNNPIAFKDIKIIKIID